MDSERIAALPVKGRLSRGDTIGRYTVLALVGRGGMGDVYACYDPELDRKVAVKLMRTQRDGANNATVGRVRLQREAQAIAKLSHPNVVVVYDVGTIDDTVFISMEFVEGHTAGYWVNASPRSWREILDVYCAAGRGLAAAHRAGLVHRDFKPENVMVTADGEVRVMDFGLARPTVEGVADVSDPDAAPALAPGADPESTLPLGPRAGAPLLTNGASRLLLESKLTQTGATLGTPAYMAPEQFLRKPADARADQFSFCVALYEALYGRRPFGGNSASDLMANVVAGKLREPPADAKVPAWVRREVMRGLQRDPEARHPTMQALLDALGKDPARARRRLLAVVGIAAATGAVSAAASVILHARVGMCTSGAEKLAGVWESSATALSPRKLAVQRAFKATGVPFAENAFAGVHQILDRFMDGWTAMYADACAATHVRHEQSPEVLDLRMSCLSERLGRVKALTDVFASANPTVVENAIAAAGALPPLARCADVALLRAVVPPPEDPKVRARVAVLRREVARVKALGDSGQCGAASDAGKKLVAEAKSVDYLPLEADGLNAVTRSGSLCMSAEESIAANKEALFAATASHDTENAVEAMILLAFTEADRKSQVAAARDWIDLAEATTRGMSQSYSTLELLRLQVLGMILSKEGRPADALATYRKAQELLERTKGPEHPDIVNITNDIGMALEDMNRLGDALTYFRHAEQLAAKILGPDHPKVAAPLNNEGEVLNALHRYEEARAPLERAAQIWKRAGSSPFYWALALTNLGETLLGLGRPREAETLLEEAVGLFPSDQNPFLPAAQFALARALWTVPEERARGIQLARAARAHADRSGSIGARAPTIDAWLREHSGR